MVIFVTDKNINFPGGIESTIRRLYKYNVENKIINPRDENSIKLYEKKGELFHYFDISINKFFLRNLKYKNKILTPFMVFNHINKGIYTKLKLKILLRNYRKIHSISPRISNFLNSSGIINEMILPPVDKKFFAKSKKTKEMMVSFIGRFDKNKGIDNILNLKSSDIELYIFSYYNGRKPIIKKRKNIHILLLNSSSINIENGERMVVDILKKSSMTLFPFKNLKNTLDIPLLILESLASKSIPIITDKSGELKENKIFDDFIFNSLKEGINEVSKNYKYYMSLVNKFLKKYKFETSYVYKRLYNE